MSNWFKRLPGSRREAPGLEWRLLRRVLTARIGEVGIGGPTLTRLFGAAHAFAALRDGVTVPLVAMDGTVVHPDGRVSGGQEDQVAAGMIEQKREMRELHEIVAKQSDLVTKLLEAQQALRLRMTEVGAELERARNEAHQGELALLTAEKDLKRAEEQLATSSKRRGGPTLPRPTTRREPPRGSRPAGPRTWSGPPNPTGDPAGCAASGRSSIGTRGFPSSTCTARGATGPRWRASVPSPRWVHPTRCAAEREHGDRYHRR